MATGDVSLYVEPFGTIIAPNVAQALLLVYALDTIIPSTSIYTLFATPSHSILTIIALPVLLV